MISWLGQSWPLLGGALAVLLVGVFVGRWQARRGDRAVRYHLRGQVLGDGKLYIDSDDLITMLRQAGHDDLADGVASYVRTTLAAHPKREGQ